MTRPPHANDVEPSDWIGALYDRFGVSLHRYAVMILADPSAAADVRRCSGLARRGSPGRRF
jgi:hypothetical protein